MSRGVTSARESRQGRQRGLQGPTVSDNIIEALYSSWMRLEEFREPSHGAIPGPSRSRSAGATFGSAGYPWDGQDRGVFSRVALTRGGASPTIAVSQ